jgi:hypothetical protein
MTNLPEHRITRVGRARVTVIHLRWHSWQTLSRRIAQLIAVAGVPVAATRARGYGRVLHTQDIVTSVKRARIPVRLQRRVRVAIARTIAVTRLAPIANGAVVAR